MLDKWIDFTIERRLMMVVVFSLLTGVGVWAFLQLKVEAYPDISDPQVVVICLFPGHASEDVEQQVTLPIERALNSVPRVIGRRSRTIFGLSLVELTFEDGVDDYFARQLVIEKLRDATLPDGVVPQLGPLTSGIGEMYRYEFVGRTDTMRLRELQDWVVVPRLLQVPGVADVAPFGGLVKQYQIEVNPMALDKYHLGLQDIATAVGANNRNAGGALVDNGQQSMVVRGIGIVRGTADIERIMVANRSGSAVYVRDLGTVQIGAATPTGIFGLNDRKGGVEGIVLMRRWENPSEVLTNLHAAVDELNASLPSGIRIHPFYDRTELVRNTVKTVSRTLLEGLVIVITVLFVFLGSVRAAVLTAVTIPLSLLFAFAMMHWAGVPANLLSLGALDFGIIVDGTLVMVESMVEVLAEPGLGRTSLESIHSAARKTARPVFFSLIILISAYIPLFTLQRVERRLFSPMAFTVCAALFGSLIITLTLIPALASYVLKRPLRLWNAAFLGRLYATYEAGLRWSTRRPKQIAVACGILMLCGVALAASMGSEFLPQLDEGVIWIRSNLPPGISLDKSAEVASVVRRTILESPEVKDVMSQTGRNDSGTDPFGPNRNEYLITLHPYSEWESGKSKKELVDELGDKLRARIPAATFNFTQPIIDTSTEMATGSSADLAVMISGPDLQQLRTLAESTLKMLREVRGSADSSIEQEADQAQLRIRVNRESVARYGINVSDVQDVIQMAIGGVAIARIFESERAFDVTVRYPLEARSSVEAIGRILVPAPQGARVPLSQLAEISVENGASIISRNERQRQISVRTNIRGRDQGGFVSEAQRRFEREVRLPKGYEVRWGGQFENLHRARVRLGIILPITVALIFGLLYVTFGRARYAAVVLMSVPLAFLGGIAALFLRGMNLSVSAAVGLVSLFGVAVMSGVLIVAAIHRLRHNGMELTTAAVEGTRDQIRPVFMMVLVAMLGMLPAALASGIGSDVQRPLATVVVGGLLSIFLLVIVALPNLFIVMHEGQSRPEVKT
jgi:cobalt-zinc-cadmium resistance protein CzcA